ncbi:diguanylate cyclase (GGDEF)-like protein [Alteromonadaceae bacterium 2753L.S.0a.02]|nr:diguanylate cyclase (GGDEF)-like protein [Alteromonadaceae bacterium 2753L.S.0a.02]
MSEAVSPKFNLLPAISRTEAFLGMIACLSIIFIFAPKDWIARTFELYPTNYDVMLTDDVFSNGNSEASWVDENRQIWQCKLGAKFYTPYCSMRVSVIDEGWQGIDLSAFDTMTIWASYKGPGKTLRFYLRNRHPDYYEVSDDTSTKYNMVEIPVEQLETGFTLKMKDFSVADWWLVSKKIPLEKSHPEFNDVIYIEVQTGSAETSGTHTIQLRKILWRGEVISDETLYKGMVVSWSILIFVLLLYRMIALKVELTRNMKHQQELVAINKLLNLQNKQFEDLAKTDQLTGLLNRIGIREALYDGLNRWKEKRTPFSFVLIDIDHFKSVNDTFGHDVGDRILKESSALFANNIRRSDFLARWGGEEFILVCPDTDLYQAQVLAELLRKKLEDTELHSEQKITASFGVAALSKPSLDDLFKRADEALYEAKKQGRNRVCAIADTV